MCPISFSIESFYIADSFLEIIIQVNSDENDKIENYDKDRNNSEGSKIILIVIIMIVVIILITIIVLIIYKHKNRDSVLMKDIEDFSKDKETNKELLNKTKD